MTPLARMLRYISDGTYSVEAAWSALARQGEVVRQPSGETKFVPDDPTFPTTIFRTDGVIELIVEGSEEARVALYVKRLSAWLKVGLQQMNKVEG